jgi:DNA repair protein RadC
MNYNTFEQNIDVLSDSDLLTIVAGSPAPESLNLADMSKMTLQELEELYSPLKAKRLYCSFEIGRRREIMHIDLVKITSSKDIYDIMLPKLRDLTHEEFWVIFLNRNNRIIKIKKHSQGGSVGTVIDRKIIAKEAVMNNACGVILVHNHPSGNPKPSNADNTITGLVKAALKIMDVEVIDHVIVTANIYYSFADNGGLS